MEYSDLSLKEFKAQHPNSVVIDPHVHTVLCNDYVINSTWRKFGAFLGAHESLTPPKTVHTIADELGIDFKIITGHDNIAAPLDLLQKGYTDIGVGKEVTVHLHGKPLIHYNVLFPEGLSLGSIQEFHEEIEGLRYLKDIAGMSTLEEKVTNAGGLGIFNHPFQVLPKRLSYSTFMEILQQVNVLELNGYDYPLQLQATKAVAEKYGKALIASSDAHDSLNIGRCYTAVTYDGQNDGKKPSLGAVYEAIRKGNVILRNNPNSLINTFTQTGPIIFRNLTNINPASIALAGGIAYKGLKSKNKVTGSAAAATAVALAALIGVGITFYSLGLANESYVRSFDKHFQAQHHYSLLSDDIKT